MGVRTWLLLCTSVLTLPYFVATTCDRFESELVYRWTAIDYVWPSEQTKQEYIQNGRYIPENNAINGIKIFNDSVYMTIPRLKVGVAASLVEIIPNSTESPPLKPFPSWDMHVLGNCSSLQLVQSMEIDPNTGYMWILDTAYVPKSGIEIATRCPAKLVVWDILRNKEVSRYVFPTATVGIGLFYLNDLVLDYVNGQVEYVYMSDTLGKKLVVYNVKQNISYIFIHESMNANPRYKNITIGGDSTEAPLGINGLAMSSNFDYLYYSAVSDVNLYRIPTAVLRDSNADNTTFAAQFQVVGNKEVQSDGLYYGKRHNLYYSTLGRNGVFRWDAETAFDIKAVTPLGTDRRMEWIDSLGMDEYGYLWFTTNNLHTYFGNNTEQGTYNFFVWKVFVDDKGYLYKPETHSLVDETCDNSNAEGSSTAGVAYKWSSVDLAWPTCRLKREWIVAGKLVPENNVIENLRTYKDRLFITIPRMKTGVPVTLTEVVISGTMSPSLRPYPTWDYHDLGNCSTLQLVHSIEIDPNNGHMWILDTSHASHGSFDHSGSCPPKLIVYDIAQDQEIRRYEFPQTIWSGQYYLSGLALDIGNSSNKFAYITDSLGWKLVVYDFSNDMSHTFTHPSMNAEANHQNVNISGDVTSVKNLGIDGITVSPDFEYVYYTKASGTTLYQIPTRILRNSNSSPGDFINNIRRVDNKEVHTDGMILGQIALYYSALEKNAVFRWDIQSDLEQSKSNHNITMETTSAIVQDCRIQWTSSMTIDSDKNLWFVSRRTRPFFGNDTSLGSYNMHIWRMKVSERSYLDLTKDRKPTSRASYFTVQVSFITSVVIFFVHVF